MQEIVTLKVIENAFIWSETNGNEIDKLVISTLNDLMSASENDWFRFAGPQLTDDYFKEYWYRDKRTDKVYYVRVQTDRFRTSNSIDKLIFQEIIEV